MKHSLVAALSNMVAVKPRRQIVYPLDKLGANAPSDRVLQSQEQFALNHINCKLVLEPKVVPVSCILYALDLQLSSVNNFSCFVIEIDHSLPWCLLICPLVLCKPF